MRPNLPSFRLLRLVAPLALAASLAACTWSVPADPGQNGRERGAAPAAATAASLRTAAPPGAPADAATRELYERKCGQCHAPFSPRHATPAQWPGLVRTYGPRAGLFGEERARVTRWLQAAAR